MATARELITLALQELGVMGQGGSPNAGDAAFAFTRFRQQLDSWAAERWTLAVQNRVPYTLPSGTNTATIGPVGADIISPRPVWISGINYLNPGSSPPNEVPLAPMDGDQYQSLSIKTLQSSLPQQFFYQSSTTSTLGSLFFWPTVTQDVDLALYIPVGVGQPVSLNSTVQGPPGYEEAFIYDLAYRLAPPFGKPITPMLRENRMEALARMKRPNVQPGMLGVDAALTPASGGAYNVLTDTSTGPNG